MTIAVTGGSQDVRDKPGLESGDTLSGLDFDALCRLARDLFAVPVASLCLDDGDARWIDLAEGLDPAAWSFAASLPGHPDAGQDLLLVEDARRHAAFATQPYVVSAPGLRFCASLPCGGTAEGAGRLALFDVRPRVLTGDELRRLHDLAAIAGQSLRLAHQARDAAEREAEFRLLAETSTDTIVRGNLDGVRLYISPSVRTLLGYEPEELIGRRAMDIVHPDDVPAFGKLMQWIRDRNLDVGLGEVRQRHKDGSWVWMEASVRLTRDRRTGEPDGYVASVRDIGRRKEAEAQLQHLASHDALTGLPNRALFGQRLADALALARRSGRRFALFCMDMDGFKQVNDTLGHLVGDAVLRDAADRFRAALRPDDTVARLGGDEFAVIQGFDAAPAEAAAVAERLIQAIAAPFRVGTAEISIGLSIGIAVTPDSGLDPDRLFSAADRALYDAKLAGRNTFRFSTGAG